MDLFQIVEVTESFHHAGTKATADIAAVADELGFQRIEIRMDSTAESGAAKVRRQMGYHRDWARCLHEVSDGAVVLLQHPFHHKQLTREKTLRKLKKEKHVHFLSLIHDVEELRAFRYNDYYAHEFQTMLELADFLIVHNEVMLEWFVTRGVPEEKLINLEIFDYLQSGELQEQPDFRKSITVAGNLDTKKCGYIRQLGELDPVCVELYGPNFDEHLRAYGNISYHGSFPVDEIPGKLTSGFGLVWDGESIDGCKGLSGQYLRYNNPHKLSLYLSSGLPVIIWNEAAEAGFVKKYRVGVCVDRVDELKQRLEQVTEEDYARLLMALREVTPKLRRGYYARKAIQEALERIIQTEVISAPSLAGAGLEHMENRRRG